MLRFQKLGFLRKEGIGIGTDGTVPEFDDAGRILLCQFRVMGDHDHQTIRGNFLQKIFYSPAFVFLYIGSYLEKYGITFIAAVIATVAMVVMM